MEINNLTLTTESYIKDLKSIDKVESIQSENSEINIERNIKVHDESVINIMNLNEKMINSEKAIDLENIMQSKIEKSGNLELKEQLEIDRHVKRYNSTSEDKLSDSKKYTAELKSEIESLVNESKNTIENFKKDVNYKELDRSMIAGRDPGIASIQAMNADSARVYKLLT